MSFEIYSERLPELTYNGAPAEMNGSQSPGLGRTLQVRRGIIHGREDNPPEGICMKFPDNVKGARKSPRGRPRRVRCRGKFGPRKGRHFCRAALRRNSVDYPAEKELLRLVSKLAGV